MCEREQNPRYLMWLKYIPGYEKKTKSERTGIKREIAYALGLDVGDIQEQHLISLFQKKKETPMELRALADYKVSIDVCDCDSCSEIRMNKKEENMDNNIQTRRISHLRDRAESVFFTHQRNLQKKFGLVDDDAPMTANELIQRIKDGKFVIPEGKGDTRYYSGYNGTAMIEWRDPAVKKDRKGYDEAEKVLNKAVTELTDKIEILDPVESLKALQEFEATEF